MPAGHPPPADRFGNPVDPIVRYARGSILKSTDEEVTRMLRARQIVGDRVRRMGRESIYDLSGMKAPADFSTAKSTRLYLVTYTRKKD